MRENIKITIAFVMMMAISLLLITGCSEVQEENPAVKSNVDGYLEDSEVPQTNISYDPYSGSYSYWYIFYTCKENGSEYEGFRIVRTESEIFDCIDITKKIKPNLDDSDYFGIEFAIKTDEKAFNKYIEQYRKNL